MATQAADHHREAAEHHERRAPCPPRAWLQPTGDPSWDGHGEVLCRTSLSLLAHTAHQLGFFYSTIKECDGEFGIQQFDECSRISLYPISSRNRANSRTPIVSLGSSCHSSGGGAADGLVTARLRFFGLTPFTITSLREHDITTRYSSMRLQIMCNSSSMLDAALIHVPIALSMS